MKQCPEERNSLVYDVLFLLYLLLQGTQGMKQCPQERNSLVYDVLFLPYLFTIAGNSGDEAVSRREE